ncbi:MAG TPA: rhamnogalacturonan acetylesterase [Sphingomonas sp.]|nr:rhamnogalacturonan acetylesterase [Sphingomonas sp.]
MVATSLTRLASFAIAVMAASAAPAQVKPTIIPAPVTAAPPAATDAVQRAAIKPIVAKKIILVGDSTTQVGSGWGGAFCAEHVTSFVACVNLARGGRGTFDYRAEGSWDLALAEMRTPGFQRVYVLIQFGHNDQPGKPGRSTDLATEYPANLRRYVAEARAAGATPILVTPLTRRSFKNGSLQDDLVPWAEAVIKVARDTGTPLLDLHATSVAAVQAMGARAAIDLAETPPPVEVLAAAETGTTIAAPKTAAAAPALTSTETLDTPQGHPTIVFDYTHLGPKGARFFATQVAAGLAKIVPELRRDLVR